MRVRINTLGKEMLDHLLVTTALAAATLTDIRWKLIHDTVPSIVAAAGIVTYGTPALILLLLYLAWGTFLQHHDVWRSADTDLFAALGAATTPNPLIFLFGLLPFSLLWVGYSTQIREERHPPFAPVFLAAYLTFILL